jgi:uncharacterized protein involved in exopolysaccharide biosynthesis
MNTQEFVDQKLRMALGSLHVELVLAQTRIAELEETVAVLNATLAQAPEAVAAEAQNKPNGKHAPAEG